MPQNRFIHPKRGHDGRFANITDLEWRVHDAYLIAADNFGVMRYSSVSIKAADEGLSGRPDRMVLRCIDALIERGIVVDFIDGERRYVLQLDWQDDQRVKYPTRTFQPKPPDALLRRCSGKTQRLFVKYPGGQREDGEDNDDETLSTDVDNISETFSTTSDLQSRVDDRLTANGLRLILRRQEEGQREWFAAFWQSYPKHKKKLHAEKAWMRLNPDDELRAKIALAVTQQRQSVDWQKENGQFIPLAASWLNGRRWEDDAPVQGSDALPLPMNGVSEKAVRFLEQYKAVYAKVRRGANYEAKDHRDAQYANKLVNGWPDETRLLLMAEIFLHMNAREANNIPGTPGQFLHMAPECDARLREHGK